MVASGEMINQFCPVKVSDPAQPRALLFTNTLLRLLARAEKEEENYDEHS